MFTTLNSEFCTSERIFPLQFNPKLWPSFKLRTTHTCYIVVRCVAFWFFDSRREKRYGFLFARTTSDVWGIVSIIIRLIKVTCTTTPLEHKKYCCNRVYSFFANHGYFHGYFEITVQKNNRVTAILSVLPIANRSTLIFFTTYFNSPISPILTCFLRSKTFKQLSYGFRNLRFCPRDKI